MIRLAILIVQSVLVYAAMQGSRMSVSLTALQLTQSAAVAGVLAGMFSLMPVLVGLAAGRLIDRRGLHKPVMLAMALSLLGLLLPFLWPSLWTVALASMTQGAAFITAAMGLSNAAALMGGPEERIRNLAWVYLGNSAGMAIGPLLAGFGIDHLGHRGSFALLAALPLLSLLMQQAARRQFQRPVHPVDADTPRGSLMELLRSGDLRALLVAQAMMGLSLESFYFLMPLHGTQVGLSASVIGGIASCAFAANFASRSLLPLLVRRFGETRVVAGSFVLVALAVVPLGHVSSVGALMLLAAGCGLTHGVIFPVLTALFYGIAPAGRQGELGGVRTMIGNGTASGTQLAAGALSATLGIAPVMWVVGASALWGAWFVHRRVRVPRLA